MPTPTAYDDLSYESLAYPQTHPDRLATVATLFGVKPAPVDGCRVLEIGCASGGNLLPMAAGLRASEFVGVDLSAAQIVSVRIWMRVRGDVPERGFTDNRNYQYAGVNYTPAGAEATFRRMLISRTIQLRNTRTL